MPHTQLLAITMRALVRVIDVEEYPTRKPLVVSGGAQGFDHILSVSARRLQVPYVVVLPSPGYGDYYWTERGSVNHSNQYQAFQKMLDKSERVFYVMDTPRGTNDKFGGANFDRNQAMVDVANHFLVYDSHSPGTADCYRRIKRAEVPYTFIQ